MRAATAQAAIFLGALAITSLAGSSAAQEGEARPATIDSRGAAKDAERRQREDALREVERRAAESNEAGRRLAAEIERLRADSATLSAALVAAGAQTQSTESRVRDLESRLATIAGSETAIKTALEGRREVLGEILAVLQRLGGNAAPALLIRPEDILAAIRSAVLLGAVVPGLRDEADGLAKDLAELARLRDLATADRASLAEEAARLEREWDRLDALVRLRREQVGATEALLRAERSRSAALGTDAKSLKDLVDRLDGELAAARRDAAAERQRAEAEVRQVRERFAAAATRDPVRLVPKMPFAEARGTLGRPVTGAVLREYGAPDGQGGILRGTVLAAPQKGLVTAPADGSVSYAGPFRSFGRLLIINAGEGYYLLLAGMDEITVETGQFVLAGEPVGRMGETGAASAALSIVEGGGPALYVEFRKDGGPIDPRPWWAKSQSGRVRG